MIRGPYKQEFCSYQAMHFRVKKLWGKASGHRCILCGNSAEEWGYDGSDPTAVLGGSRCASGTRESLVFYSVFPEFYAPYCRPCHRMHDRRICAIQLREYRNLLYDTGLTHEQLREKLGV